jgi:hypothetical protein
MKVLIRGHVRQSLDTKDFYWLLKRLDLMAGIEIYMQTWSVKQNALSWRPMIADDTEVTPELILDYMGDLSSKIKKIIVLDEKVVVLSGRTDGLIGNSKMPIKGWKYMLTGMKAVTDYVNCVCRENEFVLLTRFDILTQKPESYILDFVRQPLTRDLVFAHDASNEFVGGCDNLMLGRIRTFASLLKKMTDLDIIINRYPNVKMQELLFPLVYNETVRKRMNMIF